LKSGSLNLLEPSGPVQACDGFPLPLAFVSKSKTAVPQVEMVKYLGLHFDKRLTWKNHVAMKRKLLDLKPREIYWLTGKYSPLSLENKLLIYKTVLKPV
jgi:hypothetical protein